jgi:hypothetical protein
MSWVCMEETHEEGLGYIGVDKQYNSPGLSNIGNCPIWEDTPKCIGLHHFISFRVHTSVLSTREPVWRRKLMKWRSPIHFGVSSPHLVGQCGVLRPILPY